jgi:hypothetical protein
MLAVRDKARAMRGHLFSIGHSRHPLGAFLSLLAQHGIEVLVDVRSTPYSRFSPQLAIGALRAAVTGADRDYVFLGKELGGRPEGAEFYDGARCRRAIDRRPRACGRRPRSRDPDALRRTPGHVVNPQRSTTFVVISELRVHGLRSDRRANT